MNWALGARAKDHTEQAAQRAALRRIRDWVRENFRLAEEDVVSVNEVDCQLPGCPPLETVIVFWTGDGANRHHYKVFKKAADVAIEDLPPWWMKDALIAGDEFECSCC